MTKTIFFLLILFLSSCGLRDSKDPRQPSNTTESVKGGRLLINSGDLTGIELGWARLLCEVFEKKIDLYSTDYLNKHFHFQVENRKCSELNTSIKSLKTILVRENDSEASFIYKVETGDKSFQLVQSHQQGDLKVICNILEEYGSPKKQYMEGDYLLDYNFEYTNTNKIRVTIKMAKKRANTNAYDMALTREYEFKATTKLAGLETTIIEKKVCANTKEESLLKRTFIEIGEEPGN